MTGENTTRRKTSIYTMSQAVFDRLGQAGSIIISSGKGLRIPWTPRVHRARYLSRWPAMLS